MNTKFNKIYAEISAGELIDKITILEIKHSKIKEKIKLQEINKELLSLKEIYNKSIKEDKNIKDLSVKLKNINLKLWDIEDSKRLAEKIRNLMKSLLHFQEMFISSTMRERKLKWK